MYSAKIINCLEYPGTDYKSLIDHFNKCQGLIFLSSHHSNNLMTAAAKASLYLENNFVKVKFNFLDKVDAGATAKELYKLNSIIVKPQLLISNRDQSGPIGSLISVNFVQDPRAKFLTPAAIVKKWVFGDAGLYVITEDK